MESRGHYALVGLFVLLLGAGAVIYALWIGGWKERHTAHRLYYTYMHESVSGLPKDGEVKYMGVSIGKVTQIYIDPTNPTYVRLTLQLPADFLIRKGMYAQLSLAGITGIEYIEIVGGRRDAPLLQSKEGEIPVIPSRPSALSKLGETLPEAAVGIAETFKRLNRLLDDDTILNLQLTVAHMEETSHRLESLLNQKNLTHIDTILRNLARASQRLESLFQTSDAIRRAAATLESEGRITLRHLRTSADAVERLSVTLRRKAEAGQWDLRDMLEQTLRQTDTLLRSTQTLIYLLQEDAQMLKESPRDLFFKESEPLLGPGERR